MVKGSDQILHPLPACVSNMYSFCFVLLFLFFHVLFVVFLLFLTGVRNNPTDINPFVNVGSTHDGNRTICMNLFNGEWTNDAGIHFLAINSLDQYLISNLKVMTTAPPLLTVCLFINHLLTAKANHEEHVARRFGCC